MQLISIRLCVLVLTFWFCGLNDLVAQNWTRFRGPNGSGLALGTKLPTSFSADDYLWKIELAGSGSSSPVIWEDKLFVTSCNPKTAEVVLACIQPSTGKEFWQKKFASKPYRVHKWNSYASSTPAVDANHVYVTYANPDETVLVALDHDGNQIWKRDFGRWQSQHGFSASPIVYDDKVILFNSQQAERLRPGTKPGSSRLIAVAAKDGTDLWESPLTTTRACYAVPGIYTDDQGNDQVIACNTGDGFFSINPKTGSRNWASFPFRMRTVAVTLIAEGLIIGSNGSGGGGNYLVAVRPDPTGKNAPTKAYELQKANYVPSPIAVNQNLFLFTDKGIGRCVDLQTGKTHWEKRISSAGFSGSPVATDSHLYIVDPAGQLYVIAASRQFELVSDHDLGQPSRATPAIANQRIYFRTAKHLICVGG